jgi:hypothetical protein
MEGMPRFATLEPTRVQETSLEIGPNGMSLDLLRAVYRNAALPLVTRMRAAMACLPFESPKLAVTAVVSEQNFAEALERRLQNMERINSGGTIEAKPVPQVEAKPQMPRVADRRYRRI